MADEKVELVAIPDNCSSQFSDAQFELKDGHIMVYYKFLSLGNNTLRANKHDPGNVIGSAPGCFVFDDPELIRRFLHQTVDSFVDDAVKVIKGGD